jgi:hypothetical protein
MKRCKEGRGKRGKKGKKKMEEEERTSVRRWIANTVMNVAWSLIGAICGGSAGYWHAYVTVGSNPGRGRNDLLEAMAVRPIVGAVLGAIAGAVIAYARSGRYAFFAPQHASKPWHEKLPVEAIVWPLLLIAALWLYLSSPGLEAAAE